MTVTNILEAPEALSALRSLYLFEGVADDILRSLANKSQVLEFKEGDCIFRENDIAKNVYFIVEGSVALVVCRPSVGCRQLVDVGEGQLVGWSPLLKRERVTATAKVRESTTVVEIPAACLAQVCEDNPVFFGEFMMRIAQIVADRLNATRLQLLDLSGIHLPEVTIESD